ncbi:hypothetical protein J6590_048310 [Homalodisca vitripennis]|nr:hypothetical protein J6590_048310 [Homalodisca vitripennis]
MFLKSPFQVNPKFRKYYWECPVSRLNLRMYIDSPVSSSRPPALQSLASVAVNVVLPDHRALLGDMRTWQRLPFMSRGMLDWPLPVSKVFQRPLPYFCLPVDSELPKMLVHLG